MRVKHSYQKLKPVIDNSSDEDSSTTALINNGKSVKLKQNIGVADGISVVVGSMIGSGIFIVPTGVLEHCNGDMLLSMLIWVIGGIISLLVALCFCELGTLITESGGMAPFLKTIYGDVVCFVFLWIYLLTACPQAAAVQIIALG